MNKFLGEELLNSDVTAGDYKGVETPPQIQTFDPAEEKARQEKEGYGVTGYFLDDTTQNVNEFARFSMDILERGLEIATGDTTKSVELLSHITPTGKEKDAIQKYLGSKEEQEKYKLSIFQLPAEVREKLTNFKNTYSEWKRGQEKALVEQFQASQFRQNVYAQDKNIFQRTALLGLSLTQNAFLDPNNIYFGGFGSKALVKLPMAEYVYNMDDVYDKHLVNYEAEDYLNMAKIYGMGKALGFAGRKIGEYGTLWKTADEMRKSDEGKKADDYFYRRGRQTYENKLLPYYEFDEKTSPKAFINSIDDVEVKNEILDTVGKVATLGGKQETKPVTEGNLVLDKDVAREFLLYVDNNKAVEGRNPAYKQFSLMSKGNSQERFERAFNNGIIESDLDMRNEVAYREANKMPLVPVINFKEPKEYVKYVSDLMYHKLVESGLDKQGVAVADFETFKGFVEKYSYDKDLNKVLGATEDFKALLENEGINKDNFKDYQAEIINFYKLSGVKLTQEVSYDELKSFVENSYKVLTEAKYTSKETVRMFEQVKNMLDSGQITKQEYDLMFNIKDVETEDENAINQITRIFETNPNVFNQISGEDIAKNWNEFISSVEKIEVNGKKPKKFLEAVEKGEITPLNLIERVLQNGESEGVLEFRDKELLTTLNKDLYLKYSLNKDSETYKVIEKENFDNELKKVTDVLVNNPIKNAPEFAIKEAERNKIYSFVEAENPLIPKDFWEDKRGTIQFVDGLNSPEINGLIYLKGLKKWVVPKTYLQIKNVDKLEKFKTKKEAYNNLVEDFKSEKMEFLKSKKLERLRKIFGFGLDDNGKFVKTDSLSGEVGLGLSVFLKEFDKKVYNLTNEDSDFRKQWFEVLMIDLKRENINISKDELMNLITTKKHTAEQKEKIKEIVKSEKKRGSDLFESLKIDTTRSLDNEKELKSFYKKTLKNAEDIFGKDSDEYRKFKLHFLSVKYDSNLENAIEFYQGTGNFKEFNDKIITNRTNEFTEAEKRTFNSFNKYFESDLGIIEDPITVYRGSRIDYRSENTVFSDVFKNLKVGDVIKNDMFTSVSSTPSVTTHFARVKDDDISEKFITIIRLPKGSKILPFGKHHNYYDENESLLNMNSQMVVNDIIKINNYGRPLTVIETTLLEGEYSKAKEEFYEQGYYSMETRKPNLSVKANFLGKDVGLQLDHLKLNSEKAYLLNQIHEVLNQAKQYYSSDDIMKVTNTELRQLDVLNLNKKFFEENNLDYQKFYDSYLEIEKILQEDYNNKIKKGYNYYKRDIKTIEEMSTKTSKMIMNGEAPIYAHPSIIIEEYGITEKGTRGSTVMKRAYNYIRNDEIVNRIFDKLEERGLTIHEGSFENVKGVMGFYNNIANTIVLNAKARESAGMREVMPKIENHSPTYSYTNSPTYAGMIMHETGHAVEKNFFPQKFFLTEKGIELANRFGFADPIQFIASDSFRRFFSVYPTTELKGVAEMDRDAINFTFAEAFAEIFEKAFNPMTVIYDDNMKNVLNFFRKAVLDEMGLGMDNLKVNVDVNKDKISVEKVVGKLDIKENKTFNKDVMNLALTGFKTNRGEQLTKEFLLERYFNDPDNTQDKPFKEAIFIFNDGDKILKYDGGFDEYGGRGIDHNSLWSLLDSDTDLRKLFDTLPIACIVPETETVLVNKAQLPYLSKTLFKNYPTTKWQYEEIDSGEAYDPKQFMAEYNNINFLHFPVEESIQLYKLFDGGEEQGRVENVVSQTIKNVNVLFEMEQKSNLRTEQTIKTEDGKYKVYTTAGEYDPKALNTAKEDSVISAITPLRNELKKNAQQSIYTVGSMLWNDTKYRYLLENLDEITKEFTNSDLIMSIKKGTKLAPLTPNSRLNANFSENLRLIFEEFIKFKSKEYDSELPAEVMAIDTFYHKNIVQSLLREKNQEFINTKLMDNLKEEIIPMFENKELLQGLDLKKYGIEIKQDTDLIDVLYLMQVKTNRDNNSTPIMHSEIADLFFKSREHYEKMFEGMEKDTEIWLPQIVEGAIKNMSNYRMIDEVARVTSEKWTNTKKSIQIASKSASMENLVNNELAHTKSDTDNFISRHIKKKGFITKEKEMLITELENSGDEGVQRYFNKLRVYMEKSGMTGVYNPFIARVISYKYLTSLNFLNEATINKRAVYNGFEKFGLIKPSQYLSQAIYGETEYYRMIKEIATLTKHLKNNKNFDYDKIENLEDRLLVKTWIENDIMNDEDLIGTTKLYKGAVFLSQGAKGQTMSDVHRKHLAYWDLYNMFAKGLPIQRENDKLKGTLTLQGIDEARFSELQTYLKNMDKDRLYKILFDGAITKNDNEDDIAVLFKTIVEQSGESFDALSRETQTLGKFGNAPIMKYMLMYKRYAMTQLSGGLRDLSTQMRNDGTVEDTGLFHKVKAEDVVRGSYRVAGDMAYFLERGIAGLGLMLLTGYLVGDEVKKARSEAILQDLLEGFLLENDNLLQTVADMTYTNALDNYGLNFTLTGSVPVVDLFKKPFYRVQLGLKNEVAPQEIAMGTLLGTMFPEVISRAYDTVTLDKEIYKSLKGVSSKNANRYYRKKISEVERFQRREAYPQGLIQMFPFMLLKAPEYMFDYFQRNPQQAEEITKNYDKDINPAYKSAQATEIVDTAIRSKRAEAIHELEETELEKMGISYNQQLTDLSPTVRKNFNKYLEYTGLSKKEAHLFLVEINDKRTDEEKMKFMLETIPEQDRKLFKK